MYGHLGKTPEMAHRIGLELCKKNLKDEYEFVLSTHIDKGHIHNHIIFNSEYDGGIRYFHQRTWA